MKILNKCIISQFVSHILLVYLYHFFQASLQSSGFSQAYDSLRRDASQAYDTLRRDASQAYDTLRRDAYNRHNADAHEAIHLNNNNQVT